MNLNLVLEVFPKQYLEKRCATCLHSSYKEYVDEKGQVSYVQTLCSITDDPMDPTTEILKSKCTAYEPEDEAIIRINDYKELI